jgi:hypothetical protein
VRGGTLVAGGADLPVKARPAPVQPPGSFANVWLKALGSWTDRSNVVAVDTGFVDPNVNLSYDQKSYGIIGGFHLAAQGLWGPNDAVVFGPMGGYIDSKVNFDSYGTSFKMSGGTFGVSGSYLSGGFFIDALAKVDMLNLKLDGPQLAGIGDVDLTTWGVIGNVGYRFGWGGGGAWNGGAWGGGRLFFEPSAVLAYAKTNIDDLATLNSLGADINWGDGDSFRGAIGARLGVSMGQGLVAPGAPGTWASGKWAEAWILGRVWHEFLGDNNSVTLVSSGNSVTLTDQFDGTFGEIKGGVDLFGLNGWGAFVNAGVKFNDEITTVTAKGGVTYRWGWR